MCDAAEPGMREIFLGDVCEGVTPFEKCARETQKYFTEAPSSVSVRWWRVGSILSEDALATPIFLSSMLFIYGLQGGGENSSRTWQTLLRCMPWSLGSWEMPKRKKQNTSSFHLIPQTKVQATEN